MSDRLWFIVPAAGRGDRADLQVPKQFALVGDKTVLELTVARLLEIPEADGIVVPLPRGFADVVKKMESLGSPRKPVIAVEGGSTRQESVCLGLRAIPPGAQWVGVHDGARPRFTKELVYRVWEAAKTFGAAVPGIRPRDTVKRVRGTGNGPDLFVDVTFDRDTLVNIQTPQVFRADLLRLAYERALDLGTRSTDDSGLVEEVGQIVAVVKGERTNIKLTYPEDFELLRALPAAAAVEACTPPKTWAGNSEPCGKRAVGHWVTGFGFDIHPLKAGRKCVLGGVLIESCVGPVGHSDGDVLCHAIMDAILGGLSKGDIGIWFPPGDPFYKDASSLGLMKSLWQTLRTEANVLHIDATVVAETPRISPYYSQIRSNIAQVLGIAPEAVSVKATTAEKLGFLGRGEGMAAFAVVTLLKQAPGPGR